jgi:hypothetical protein
MKPTSTMTNVIETLKKLDALKILKLAFRVAQKMLDRYPVTMGLATGAVMAAWSIQKYLEFRATRDLREVAMLVDSQREGAPQGRRRTVRRRRFRYISGVVLRCKAKFPERKVNDATKFAIQRFAKAEMEDDGHRPCHIARDIPLVVAATLLPSVEEIMVSTAMRGVYYASRTHLFNGGTLLGLLIWTPLGWIFPGSQN